MPPVRRTHIMFWLLCSVGVSLLVYTVVLAGSRLYFAGISPAGHFSQGKTDYLESIEWKTICGSWEWPPPPLIKPEFPKFNHSSPKEWKLDAYRCPYTWLDDYSEWHRAVLSDEKHEEDYDIAIWSLRRPEQGLTGMGDRFRGMAAGLVQSAASGKAYLIDWRRDGLPMDILHQMFTPTSIQWNATEIHVDLTLVEEAIEAGELLEAHKNLEFLRDFSPMGMDAKRSEYEARVNEAIVDGASLSGVRKEFRERVASISPDTFHMQSQHGPSLFYAEAESFYTHSFAKLSPFRIHSLIERLLKRKGHLSRTAQEINRMSDWELRGCLFTFLFNKLAPPLREFYLAKLVRLAEDYRRVLNLGEWPDARNSVGRCAGGSFSQCMNHALGTRMRPIIGIHFRVGDQVWTPNSDRRYNPLDFVDTLRCAMRLAKSLGFGQYAILLATDCDQLANESSFISEKVGVPIITTRQRGGVKHTRGMLGGRESVLSHLDSMASLLSLSSVDGLVVTHSGFGALAWYLGGFDENHVALSHWGNGMDCYIPRRDNRHTMEDLSKL